MFAVVAGGPALIVVAAAADASDDVFGVIAIGMLVGFVAVVVLLWVRIFAIARRLKSATTAWVQGDIASAVSACQASLPPAFRGDFRTKAFHVLGLCAEASADFAEAADLFRRAELAMPTMAAPARKSAATVLCCAHQALCLCAMGRPSEAGAAFDRAAAAYRGTGQSSVWDSLLDDGDWGIGAASLNHVLSTIEHGRSPVAVLYLAEARMATAMGRAHDVLAILERGRAWLDSGLLPRERALAAKMDELARQALQPGYPAQAPADPWAARALGIPSMG